MGLASKLIVLDTEFDPLSSLNGHVGNALVVGLLALAEDSYVVLLVLSFVCLVFCNLQLLLDGLEYTACLSENDRSEHQKIFKGE